MAVHERGPLAQAARAGTRRTAPIVLELDLTDGVLEAPPGDVLSAALSQRRPRLHHVLAVLRHATRDPHVRALVVKVGGRRLSFTQAQELRAAIGVFRRAGKITTAWAETIGDFGLGGNVPYLLATGCERIYLQPSGDVSVTGIGVENSFLHDALGKLDIAPQLGQRHEYKTAANTFLERGYTEAHREMSERIVASLSEQLVDAIAEGRGLPPDEVRATIDRAPLLATEALDAGLVDGLAYRDEVYADVRRQVGEHARLEYVTHYHGGLAPGAARRLVARRRHGDIALIYGIGLIRLGRGTRHPFGAAMGSDTIGAAFRAAIRDDRVKAIVFRVDSPGGSHVASDAIWRHIVLARRHGTPVVVSMGRVAASGGYFVAAPADAIVAQPGTLTGSIGVLGGKMVTSGLQTRLGLTHDVASAGTHALMSSSNRGYTDGEWARVHAMLDAIYDDFTAKVADGRGLDRATVDALARGRVWTGADAHERGLVDELGGLDRAVELAKDLARLPADLDVEPRIFPRTTMLGRLRRPRSSEDPVTSAAATASLEALRLAAWGRYASEARRWGLPAAGPLTMPGEWDSAV
jgi:protease-4